jgi:4-amino-4-deoxy-L-arabinose transferase-like glycosyltransferase
LPGGGVCLTGGVLLYRTFQQNQPAPEQPDTEKQNHLKDYFNCRQIIPAIKKNPVMLVLLPALLLILLIVGYIALNSPPNTWDSMTYHMPRVFYWQQFQSVDHYPTVIDRQLFNPPWAEFAILHLQILSDGDQFANMVQWTAMFISIIGVSAIAGRLGASYQGQLFAAIFCATLPMGILQGSSTQNDYVIAMWLVCLIYFILHTFPDHNNRVNIAAIGVSVGLAVLTKGTAYVYVLAVLLLLGLYLIWTYRQQFWKPVMMIGIIGLALNGSHYIRNYQIYDSPLTSTRYESAFSNETLSISVILSNFSRNMASQVTVPSLIDNQLTIHEKVDSSVRDFHDLINADVDDPRTSYNNNPFKMVDAWQVYHEDFAGNPFHLLLVLVFLIVYPFTKVARQNMLLTTYAAGLIGTFLLFSLVFKWQPWGTRLQLPLFVAIAPFAGIVASRFKPGILWNGVALVLIFSSVFWLFKGNPRPLIKDDVLETPSYPYNIMEKDHTDGYFNFRPELQSNYGYSR